MEKLRFIRLLAYPKYWFSLPRICQREIGPAYRMIILLSLDSTNFLHHNRKSVQTKYHKGAGTKMHECLVGDRYFLICCVVYHYINTTTEILQNIQF